MAYGDIKLFTVEHTSSSVGSLFPNYPIKQKFKQTIFTPSPTFPNSYTLHSSIYYWFPFDEITQSDENHIVYNDDDEFSFDNEKYKIAAKAAAPAINKQKASYIIPGTRVIFANDIYISLDINFKWSKTEFKEQDNPYTTDLIPIWRRLSDTSSSPVSFWYHPLLRRFYSLSDNLKSSILPTSEDFDESKWESFTGDATEINLSNFTVRQIQELVSTGLPFDGATQIIEKNDSLSMRSINGQGGSGSYSSDGRFIPLAEDEMLKGYDPGIPKNTATVTVTRRVRTGLIGGSSGDAGDFSVDKPQMIQYYKNESGTTVPVPTRFEFDYRPNLITYSDIGANWSEIDRVNNTPYIDFKNYKLMKINFEFVIGDSNTLFTSIDSKLKMLRVMAMRPEPVLFLGFDSMFQEQIIVPTMSGGSGIVFAIIDLSITSIQRVRGADGSSFENSSLGNINRATVNMTIQELPLEGPNIIVMPKPNKDTPQVPPPPTTDQDPCIVKLSRSVRIGTSGAVEQDCPPPAE